MPEHQDAPYDPYIPSGGKAAGSNAQNANNGDPRTQALQAQIDDTVNVMKQNIHLATQRGERMDSLQDKTDNLAHSTHSFRRGANRVRKQMWWKNMKMRIWIGVGILILIAIIVVSVVVSK
ncbi:hypothetical protein BROUX41_002786 [Berkeleyomyces rouxiae]|uniref:uncharacterized protein n=1 Tax=Berkeleyomyces rouxiae TaxID=2035830 RepID=UPI003B76591A